MENRIEPMSANREPVPKPHSSFSGEVMLRRGYDLNALLEPLRPHRSGTYEVVIQQLGRLEVHLLDGNSNPVRCTSNFRLPVGSALDKEACTFYWQIDPSFLGVYPLGFSSEACEVRVSVIVVPQIP
jgi:hypothetical protein